MKDPKEFCEELEALMVKYEIDQSISIFPMEGMTRVFSYSVRKEEETEISETFDKFAKTIGRIDTETIKAVTIIMEGLIKEQEEKEENISQVTWETIANQNAEELLSEEDYEKLEEAQILKAAAVSVASWESAARHREEELRLLAKVMEIINFDSKLSTDSDC
jgi:hypothetical protein